MNEVIATNIQEHRHRLLWTQEHLAEAAGLNVRTVQRAEEGRGLSAETLTAIAGALDVTVDQLRLDPVEFLARTLGVEPAEVTPDLIAAKVNEARARYTTVPVEVVERSASLSVVFDADGMYFDCLSDDDDIQDIAAELKQWIRDLLDLSGDLEPVHEREYLKSVYEVIARLRSLQCRVSVGVHRHGLRMGDGEPMPWRTLYVIVAPEQDAKKFVMIEKNMPVRFR